MNVSFRFQPVWRLPPGVAKPRPPRDPAKGAAAVARAEAAITRLLRIGMAEDSALMLERGGWPEDLRGASDLDRLLMHPVGVACRTAVRPLCQHLASLIGREAATATVRRLEAEQRDRAVVSFPTAGAA